MTTESKKRLLGMSRDEWIEAVVVKAYEEMGSVTKNNPVTYRRRLLEIAWEMRYD